MSLDAGHGPALLAAAAAFGALDVLSASSFLSLECGKILECKCWDVEGDGSLLCSLS